MNKIYKVIWSQTLSAWIAVSETARTKSKTKSVGTGHTVQSAKLQHSAGRWPLGALAFALMSCSTMTFAQQGVTGGTASGASATATSACTTAATQAKATKINAIALGCNANALGASAISIGGFDGLGYTIKLNTLGLGSMAAIATELGVTGATQYNGSIVSRNSNSLGVSNALLSGSSIAIGNRISILNGNSINSLADLDDSSKVYTGLASAKSIAVGDTITIGTNSVTSIAIGEKSSIGNNSANAVALGARSAATKAGAVALGSDSTTATNANAPAGATVGVVNLAGNQVGSLQRNFAGSFAATAANAGRQVSVGSVGNERQIKNVAAGQITQSSTDAVNGSQLYAVVEGVVDYADQTAAVVYTDAAGNRVYKRPDGTWNTAKDGSGTAVAAGNIIASVQSADGSTTSPTKLTNVAAGAVTSTSTDAVNGSQLHGLADSIKTSIGGNTVVNPDGSITTSNLGDTGEDNIDDALKHINNIATNANKGWKLSTNGGTAAAVAPDQTVDFANTDGNVAITNSGSNVTVNLNKDLNLSADGSVTAGQTKLNNDGVVINNADPSKVVSITSSGISAGNNKVTNVQDGLIADGSKDAVNGGQIKNIANSIQTSIGGNTIVNPDGSISTSNIGNTGKDNINDAIESVNNAAVKAKTTVTAGQNIVVTPGVNADGSSNYEVKTADDVSFKNANISNNLTVGGSATANEFKAGNTMVNNSGITIANADPNKVVSVTDAGISAGGNKVTNVAPGTISATSTDAVNGSQLNASNNAFNTYLGGGATYNDNTKTYTAPTYNVNNATYNNVGDALGALNQADTTINNRIDLLGNQLEQSFRNTNNRIDDVEKLANAGVAAAMSLENAPYIPGKYTYAVGAAYHGGENAVGATLRKTADNGRWSLTGGVAVASQGDPSVRIGISGVID